MSSERILFDIASIRARLAKASENGWMLIAGTRGNTVFFRPLLSRLKIIMGGTSFNSC